MSFDKARPLPILLSAIVFVKICTGIAQMTPRLVRIVAIFCIACNPRFEVRPAAAIPGVRTAFEGLS